MKTMFDIIKKQNGEHFAKAIRNYDSGIFDIPNIDKIVRYAGREAEPIMNYLISLKNVKIKEKEEHQNPIELLDKAGYNAYVVHNLEEQNAISKYFEPSERLCTFNDNTRFEKYYIINAIRKDADSIRRCDFDKPMREDKYGTSVISIQILKSGGFISIKNRYNHTVSNPDNTFNSCPDNIIDGLSDAIKEYFNVDFSAQKVDLPDWYVLQNNRIIKYNYEHNNVYVGDGFYASDGNITEINKSSEILLDTILFNFKTKTFQDVTQTFYKDVYSERLFKKVTKDKKIIIRKNPDKTYSFFADNIQIAVLSESKIVSLTLPGIKEINEIPHFGSNVRYLSLPDTEVINDRFFAYNELLEEINAPKLKVMRNKCFEYNKNLKKLYLPELINIGVDCFSYNEVLSELYLPKLKIMKDACFRDNIALLKLDFPMLESIGSACFSFNNDIYELNTPKLQSMGSECFRRNIALLNLNLPNLSSMGESCFVFNKFIRSIFMPSVSHLGEYCFEYNTFLYKEIYKHVNDSGEVKNGGIIINDASLVTESFNSVKNSKLQNIRNNIKEKSR